MNKNARGSEKMLFTCETNGKSSLADFENVEEALQASGGSGFQFWWLKGTPRWMQAIQQPTIDVASGINLSVNH